MNSITARVNEGGGWISAWRQTRRPDRMFGRYITTLVVMLTIVLVSFSELTYLDLRIRAIDVIRVDSERMLALQIDQETAVRGYDATGIQTFLQPYAHAQQPLEALISSLHDRVSDDPDAKAALEHFALLHEAWKADVALPIIAHPMDPHDLARLSNGKHLVDAQREDVATIQAVYEEQFARILALKSTIRYISASLVILAVVAIGITGYLSEKGSAAREERLLRTIISERDAESRRSEWRTKIIAMLAHDFRSSLGVIRAYTDLLQTFPEKREDPSVYQSIRNGVSDLTAMNDEALLMARMANNALNIHLRPYSIQEIVRDAANRFVAERQIAIEGADEMVMGDRQYLIRVFDNLIGNAIKYSPEGSPVTVTTRRIGENEMEIAVRDRGRGIDPADLPHVFEEFWRAEGVSERSGSGIGLFIVKKIVDAHGGQAKIESQDGVGTTVRIVLPAATAEAGINACEKSPA